ncbi:hypothetical protein [Allosphingosinicella vermicomposti]|uniref:hypothetical protein n=1 Tax=Allosphingosinicella vermicomposti TaxID=614671 RepID=UPI00131A5F94|nr:hypothetical protein [Allosphingosinicella vermicomposti]
MKISTRAVYALMLAACLSAPVQQTVASSRDNGRRYHGEIETNPNAHYSRDYYLNDPKVGQLLRCAAYLDATVRLYFAHEINGGTLIPLGPLKPRISPADAEERDTYARVSKDLLKQADGPARSLPDYGMHHALSKTAKGPKSFDQKEFEFAQEKMSLLALKQVRGGVGLQAMKIDRSRCFDLSEIAPLKTRLEARLKKTVPGMEIPTSASIKRGRLPAPLLGYLYQPNAYRHLTCAAIAYTTGTERFGLMPDPGVAPVAGAADTLHRYQAKLEPGEASVREAYRKAVAGTFDAGLKQLGLKSAADIESYRASFRAAENAVRPLIEEGLTEDLMAEPMLQCASLPTMAPFIEKSAGASAAGPLEAPEDVNGWPDRADGYLAHPVAFRNIFCSALIYSAYNLGESKSRWFAPPSNRDREWSPPDAGFSVPQGDGGDRAAIKALVYALYDAGQIDQTAKNEAKSSFGTYARDYSTTLFSAEYIVKNRQGMAAMAHGSTNCLALPQVAPLANAVRMKVGAWDKRPPSSF